MCGVVVGGSTGGVTGCSTVGPPEVTFYADGHTVNAAPFQYCDVLVRNCTKGNPASLKVRAGKPVQISVPSDVADTPWLVITQYVDASGEPKVKQQFFAPKAKLAYTATGDAPTDSVLVVEVQQLGAAFAADAQGNPILDENGNPQLVARGIWSLQLKPGS